jgi:hypothetical protein
MVEFNSTQPSFSSGIISTELFSRIDYSKLASGLKQCENWIVRPAGGAEYRTGTSFICETKYPDKKTALIPFLESRDCGYCLEFGEGYIRFYKDGKRIEKEGVPVELETTFKEDEVSEIKVAQNKNQLYIVHRNHSPMVLTRKSDRCWSLDFVDFNPNVPKVSSVTAKALTAQKTDSIVKYDLWQYAVSVVDPDGNEGIATYSGTVSSDIDLVNQNIEVSFDVPAGVKEGSFFNIYRIFRGNFYFIYKLRYDSSKTSYTLTDISFQADTTQSVKEPFSGFVDGDYPSAVGFWNQRLILASTKSKPNTIFGSRVGEYNDFTNTILNNEDEAFELTFSSGGNDTITDVIPLDDLIAVTESKIWRVVGTSPKSMQAYIESYSGSSGLRPFAHKKSILYVDSSLNTVSNFIYSYELNGYTGQNLDVLCRDLMDGYTLKDITLKDTPFGVLYCVRNDGVLLGLTYLKEENVYAWHKHTTQGLFENVCCVNKAKDDEVYTIVCRDGKRYVEMFQNQIDITEGVNESFHLDCATRFLSDEGVMSVSGLDRFNEKTVTVMADGNEMCGVVVNDGMVLFDRPYKNILVGLPFVGILEPIATDLKFSSGSSSVGLNRRITKATIRYYRSRGLWYGASENKMYQIKTYTNETFGEEIPLESNTLNTEVTDTYKAETRFVIMQKSPFPAMIQSITLGMNYGEKN